MIRRGVPPTPALALGLFVFLVFELLPVGLMPEIAADLDVDPNRVGGLLGSYALVAAVTGIPATLLCRRLPRRTVLVGCLLLLTAGQVVLALAPTLTTALAARSLVAVGHVVMWAVAPLAAADAARPGREGRAAGTVFLGSSAALFAGLPAFTFLGQLTSWRVASVVLAAGSLVAAGLLLVGMSGGATASAVTASPPTPRLPTVLVAVTTALAVIGVHACYPYLSQYAARVGVTGAAWSVLLAVGGGLGIAAVVVASRRVDPAPLTTTLVVIVACGGLALLLDVPLAPVVVVGVASFLALTAALPVVLQAAVVRVAGPRGDVTSSVYVVAYQVGIAAGTSLGGVLDDRSPYLAVVAMLLATAPAAALLRGRRTPGPTVADRGVVTR